MYFREKIDFPPKVGIKATPLTVEERSGFDSDLGKINLFPQMDVR